MVYIPTPTNPLTSQQMFDPFLPKVEISKITLEYSGRQGSQGTLNTEQLEQLSDKNPHIDASSIYLPGGAAGRQRVGSAREKAEYLESSAGGEEVKMTVDLEVRVPMSDAFAFSSVLQEDVIRRAIKIHLIYTDEASQRHNVFDTSILESSIVNISSHAWTEPQPVLFEDLEQDDSKSARDIYEDGNRIRIYTTKREYFLGAKDIPDLGVIAYSTLDPSLITLSNVAGVNLNTVSPLRSRLSGLWVLENGRVSSTVPALVVASGETLGDERGVGELWEGPAHIMQGGNNSGKWMTGATANHPPGSERLLNVITVSEPKVQDFRITRELQTLALDFALTENDIFRNLKKDLKGNRITKNQKYAYFSDFYLSRDIGNNCRFFFSIDWQRIIEENSVFGKLFQEATDLDRLELLQTTHIKDLKIIRERLNGSGEAGSFPYKKEGAGADGNYRSPKDPKLFCRENDREIIIHSKDEEHGIGQWLLTSRFEGEPPPSGMTDIELRRMAARPSGIQVGASSNFLANTTDLSHIENKGLRSYICEKTNFGPSAGGRGTVRHFTGIDGVVKSKTDGYYRYAVEIESLDNSVELISAKADALALHIKQLKKYYKAATRPAMRSTAFPPSWSPHVDTNEFSEDEVYYEPGEYRMGSFNPVTQKFTKRFIETRGSTGFAYIDGIVSRGLSPTLEKIITTPTRSVSVGGRSVSVGGPPGFLQILKFFSNKKTDQGKHLWNGAYEARIESALRDYINPYSATPESINKVIELMEVVHSRIDSILGVVYSSMMCDTHNSGLPQITMKKHISAKNKTFLVSDKSFNFFDSNLKRGLGFDFLYTTHGSHNWHREGSSTEVGAIETPTEDSSLLSQGAALSPLTSLGGGIAHSLRIDDPLTGQANLGLYEIPFGHINLQAQKERNKFFLPHFTGDLPPLGNPTDWFHVSAQVDDPRGRSFFTPGVIRLPDSFAQSINTVGEGFVPSPVDFLKAVSYTLLHRKGTTEEFLNRIRQLFGLPGPSADVERLKFSNDLATFFELFQSTTVVIPGEENWGADKTSNILPSGYKGLEDVNRAKVYGFLVKILQNVEFSEKRNYIESIEDINKREFREQVYDMNITPPRSSYIVDHLQRETDERVGLLQHAPVQTKALIWSATNSPLQRQGGAHWKAPLFDEVISVGANRYDYEPAFEYVTQIINKLEILTDYDLSKDGRILLKESKWEAFFEAAPRLTPNRQYLCRIRPYIDSKYLINRNKNYDLPTYDEYFIVTIPETP